MKLNYTTPHNVLFSFEQIWAKWIAFIHTHLPLLHAHKSFLYVFIKFCLHSCKANKKKTLKMLLPSLLIINVYFVSFMNSEMPSGKHFLSLTFV